MAEAFVANRGSAKVHGQNAILGHVLNRVPHDEVVSAQVLKGEIRCTKLQEARLAETEEDGSRNIYSGVAGKRHEALI
jgi:hypothetical protein